MNLRGTSRGRVRLVSSVALGGALALAVLAGGPATAAKRDLDSRAVLPCGKDVILTAAFRTDGRVRFEGVARDGLERRAVRIERGNGKTVARTRVRGDGTFWALAETERAGYTWLSRFTAFVSGNASRPRRLGQAVALRERREDPARSASRTRIKIKLSGSDPDRIVIGRQTGCSRYEVNEAIRMKTDEAGVAEFSLPRPDSGDPYSIYRVSTTDGWKISPPIVIAPGTD